MNVYLIPGALVVTLVVMFLVNTFSKRPLRGLWVLALIVFLAVFGSQLWVQPVGPLAWGVAWLPMFLIAAVFWFLIVMLIPPLPGPEVKVVQVKKEAPGFLATSFAFWAILIILLVVVTTGLYHVSHLPEPGVAGI